MTCNLPAISSSRPASALSISLVSMRCCSDVGGGLAGAFLVVEKLLAERAQYRRLLDQRQVAGAPNQGGQKVARRARLIEDRMQIFAGGLGAVMEGKHRFLDAGGDQVVL
jgi:hypothetical protein